jgi:hypothetical protein
MQCARCEHWVHAKCENLTGLCVHLSFCPSVRVFASLPVGDTPNATINGLVAFCLLPSPPSRRAVRAGVQAAGEPAVHLLHLLQGAPAGGVEDGPGGEAAGLRAPRPDGAAQLTHVHTRAALQTSEKGTLGLLLWVLLVRAPRP